MPQAQVLAEQPDGAWRMLSLLLGSTPRAVREDQGAAAAVRDADWPFLLVRLLLAHLGGLRRGADLGRRAPRDGVAVAARWL